MLPSPNLVLAVTYALYSELFSRSVNCSDVSVTLTLLFDILFLKKDILLIIYACHFSMYTTLEYDIKLKKCYIVVNTNILGFKEGLGKFHLIY